MCTISAPATDHARSQDMARLEALSVAYAILSKYRVEILPHSEKIVNGPVQFYENGLPAKLHLRV